LLPIVLRNRQRAQFSFRPSIKTVLEWFHFQAKPQMQGMHLVYSVGLQMHSIGIDKSLLAVFTDSTTCCKSVH
jgi:hypothetical protein